MKYIFLIVLFTCVLAMLLLYAYEKKEETHYVMEPVALKPETHSAPLMVTDRMMYVQVSVCNQKVFCIFDTGSDDVVVNTQYCVPIGEAVEKGYASEQIVVHPALKALGIKVGSQYKFQNVHDIQFSQSSDETSVLGMSLASKLKVQNWSVQYDGEESGYFTLNPMPSPEPLAICSLVVLENWYTIKLQIKTNDGQILTNMLGILDTGSSDCFVDNDLVKEGVGLSIYTSKGDILLSKINGENVVQTEGGARYKNLLTQNRALILGLPFFAGKQIYFNSSTRNIIVEELPLLPSS